MTVNTTNITSGPYIGNDASDEYSYTFRVTDKTQLKVFETTDLGARTELVVDTDYTVAGIGVDAGGTITRIAGNLPTDYEWYIRSDYDETQLSALPSQGPFFPDIHEDAFDKLTFLVQQLQDITGRTVRLSDEIDNDGDFTIDDDATARASKFLGFDANGDILISAGVTGIPISPFMATVVDDATAFEATGTLKSGYVVADKAEALLLTPEDGRKVFITSSDGGAFIMHTGASAGTYDDDGGAYTGTKFKPVGGDGSAGFSRDFVNVVTPEYYGAKGDDATDDTASMRLVFNSGWTVDLTAGKTYLTDYITVDSIDDVTFNGNGAYLKRLSTSTGADFIRGAVLVLAGCNNVNIYDMQIDGNRPNLIIDTPGNVSMNYGIGVYGSNTIGSDVLLNNGGESKGSKNINIIGCRFYRTGSTGVGTDTFGDGVFVFAVDGVTIRDCYFKDMGRWAVAAGDVFNITIDNNIVDNDSAGTALGSFDIENESGDQTNGTYSRGIRILNNKMVGRVSMTISAYDSANNDSGANHYTKDIRVLNNEMECTQYATNGVWGINVLISKRSTVSPTMSDLWIKNNVIKGDSSTRMDLGLSIQGNVTTVTMNDFHISANQVKGFTDGIYIKSTSPPAYTNFTVSDNNVAAEFDSASGTGITINANDLDGVHVTGNKVRDYGTYGILCTKNAGSINIAEVSNNFVFDGLATFTGTGIRASALTLVAKDNVVSQTGGLDFELEATSVISNASANTKYKIVELTGLTGASVQFTNALPAGCIALGVSTRVTELITGATSFDIGDGTDVDRWGNARSPNLDSVTDIQQFTIGSPVFYTVAKSVVLTANGGNFTAGAVRIAVHYIELDPPKA